MIREIITDHFLLQQKAQVAKKEDLWIGQDLQDTLAFYRQECLGMAANMIGEQKRIVIVSMGFIDLVMFNPVMVSKREFTKLKNLVCRYLAIAKHSGMIRLLLSIWTIIGDQSD